MRGPRLHPADNARAARLFGLKAVPTETRALLEIFSDYVCAFWLAEPEIRSL